VDRLAMDEATRSAVDWLLASTEPAIRHLTRRDVLTLNALRVWRSAGLAVP
jgi:hypothetical protein